MAKIALVTGANQGLGFALAKGLAAKLAAQDRIYLTARDPARGTAAVAALGATVPSVVFERLDVTDEANVAALAGEIANRHGGIDLVISNAAARIAKDTPAARQVRHFVETNNRGTTRMLAHFVALLRPQARFVVVASSFGRLTHLAPHLHERFDTETGSLAGIDAAMDRYAAAVEAGTAEEEGWPDWINIPSKVGQVAAVRIAAGDIARTRPGDGILVNAACPGLVDTEASRPWFDDMSRAQTPDAAAVDVLWLATLPPGTATPNGELVQFRKTLAWR